MASLSVALRKRELDEANDHGHGAHEDNQQNLSVPMTTINETTTKITRNGVT
jgi:hypothetical protein